MDDIALWDIADLVSHGSDISIYIDTINEHPAIGCRAKTGDGVHQGGLTAAALSHYNHEFIRLDDQREIMQNIEFLWINLLIWRTST